MDNLCGLFEKYQHSPIALYGLGTETKNVLSELAPEFHIVGLLDGFREEGDLYGKPIIPLSSVIQSGVGLIIVVARPGSCRAIARRIGGFCAENHIKLLDIRGRDLCGQRKSRYHLDHVEGVTRKQLMEVVSGYEIVSFDLFDTLIMRNVLYPTDIIEMMDYKLRERGVCLPGFCERRLQAEKELSKDTAPTLEEIYQYVLDALQQPEVTAGELAELEWRIDCSLIVPRREMADFLSGIYGQGKKVYIVTDTYYREEQLIKLLEKCGITEYTDILASCEYGVSKTQGLFGRLQDIACGQSCFHVGDDVAADIESAKKCGISACRIYSGVDILELTGYLGLWDTADTLSARIKMGLFVARMFNSPFQFESEEKKLSVKDAYDIGYLLLAPVISDFVIWFRQQAKDIRADNIWLGARDGYLIKKLYDALVPDNKAVYFLTSRTAAVRAGMADEEDIAYVAGMKFSGSIQEQMKERFGITVEGEEIKPDSSLADYAGRILTGANAYRKNYQAYIKTLGLKGGSIVFFDFVAKGTTQMYLSRLVEQPVRGLYFLRLEKEFMRDKKLDICSFYENEESHDSAIYEDYYILETVLTAPEPSVLGFDEKGRAVYAEETRSREDIDCFLKVQEGIINYFKEYIRLCPEPEKGITKDLDEILVGLLHKFEISDRSFLKLKVEDPFFNRMTDIADLL